jgi:integrase
VVERRGPRGVRYGLRFHAYGKRRYLTAVATTRAEAEIELQNLLADVRRGIWDAPAPDNPSEPPAEIPTFHVYGSQWIADREPELKSRSIEALKWALSGHLLPHFKDHLISEIGTGDVDAYRRAKVREREEQLVERPLSNGSINRTIAVLAQLLDSAVEDEYLASNPARGKRRRLKTERPRRTWLELEELRALLDAAREHRALLATMALAGLRVGELCSLRWSAVDLANGRLRVLDSKTQAGVREVDLSPDLRDELAAHKARSRRREPGDFVFLTRAGTPRDRHNVRVRVLKTAIKRANARLVKAGKPPIQDGVTNHTLRRTFASLLYEAGASPAYVMAQMGHTSSALALDVYARMMRRERDTGARMDALLRGADWAQMGTIDADERAAGAALDSTESRKARV